MDRSRNGRAVVGCCDFRAALPRAIFGRNLAVPNSSQRATILIVQVVLQKVGRGGRTISGRLVRAPRKGSVIVIEFSDGMHEYVTTPVRRVLKLAGGEVFYIETMNSRYRLEIESRDVEFDDVMGGSSTP